MTGPRPSPTHPSQRPRPVQPAGPGSDQSSCGRYFFSGASVISMTSELGPASFENT